MSKTILAQVDGFTPVIDGIVDELGLISAAVFGKAWRYCQMSDGVCKAAQDRIANELGISRATVNDRFAELTRAGYLEDTTPNLLGMPHQYRDTGKANLSISLTGSSKNSLQGGVKEIDTKKEVKERKKDIKTSAEKKSAKSPTPPEIKLFREVTERYPNKINYENVVALIQGVSKRVGHECTAEDLRPFYAAWCANGWNKLNLAWLSYAEHGELPSAQKKNSYQNSTEPKAFDGIRKFLEAQNVNAS